MAVASGVLGCVALYLYFRSGHEAKHEFLIGVCGRLSIVLATLWLAWPSLKRPANWLPAGVVVAALVGLLVIAVQPRLVAMVGPVIGLLLAAGAVRRIFGL